MALSGSFTGSTNNQYVKPKITWSAIQFVEDNYSEVTAILTYSRTNSGYTTSGRWSGSITINGATVEGSSGANQIYITQNSNTLALSVTVRVPHNADGSKSIEISCTGTIPGANLTKTTCSATVTLDTIPRQAKITNAPHFTSSGNPPTVYYDNPAGDNVAKLEICISNSSANSNYTTYKEIDKTGTSYTFTAEDIEALKELTVNSLDVTFVIHTVIGETHFYSSSSVVTFTMVEDETTKPTVSMTFSKNNDSLPSEFKSLYVQGKTKLNISLSAEGKYNADIKSYSAEIDDKTYNSLEFTSDVIQSSGKVKVIGYAKDSRGFTGSFETSIDVVPYSKPLVVPIGSDLSIFCYRSEDGKRVGSSTDVLIKAKKVFSSNVPNNSCALQWRRKLANAEWNDEKWIDLITDDKGEYDDILQDVVFDLKTSYTVQIRAIDNIGETDVKTIDIPTEDVALHLGRGGKNVSVGTYCDYSEDYTFYSAWKGIFDKGLLGTSHNYSVTDVLTFAEESSEGMTPIIIDDSTNRENLPDGDYDYSVGIVHKRAADQYNVILMDYIAGNIAINVHFKGTWTGWKYLTPQ